MSSFEQKVNTVAGYLPNNKDIFTQSVQFQTTQQVPLEVKSKYLDDHMREIATMLVQRFYKQKQADEIEEIDIIGDMEEWLSSGEVKFKLEPKEEVKKQRVQSVERMPQVVPRNVQNLPTQQNGIHRPQRIQNQQFQPTQNIQNVQNAQNMQPTAYTQPYQPHQQPQQQQTRPQSYYQTQPPQGRQNTIKYTPKLPQTPHPDLTPLSKQQINVKKIQYEKQNVMWIDSLSKCFTYPQKRFYLLPEMHPRKKY